MAKKPISWISSMTKTLLTMQREGKTYGQIGAALRLSSKDVEFKYKEITIEKETKLALVRAKVKKKERLKEKDRYLLRDNVNLT